MSKKITGELHLLLDSFSLKEENERLLKENQELKDKYENLEKKFQEMTLDSSKRLTNLEERLNETQKQNNILQEENNNLSKENAQLKSKIQKLEKKIQDIESKLFQMDSREAVMALENYIVLEILGSKNQMKLNSIYTIKEVQKTEAYENSKWKTGEKEQKICQIINYVKEIGNILIHGGNLNSPKEKIESQFKLAAQDMNDDDEMDGSLDIIAEDMIKLLESCCVKYKKPFGRGPFYKVSNQ